MKRRLRNNLPFLSALFILSGLLTWRAREYPLFLSLGAGVTTAVAFRIIDVCQKRALEWLNGPARYCKGAGIEIGSGGYHSIRGSMLVDLVDDFSASRPYKVDYLADAHSLPEIETGSLDYVCASHVLEHLTNPIKAILEWARILKPGGIIWLKIPDKRKTFDRKRERTVLKHLIDDFEHNAPIDDPTHIIDCNTNSDPPRNERHPYIHNHVWIPEDIAELFAYISANHTPLEIIHCGANTCKKAQDFWIAARKPIETRVP